MTLSLSSAEHARVVSTIEALLSPLEYDHVDAWRSVVTESAKRLVGADTVTFWMPTDEAKPLYNRELDPDALRTYAEHYASLDTAPPVVLEHRLDVVNQSVLFAVEPERGREYLRGACYNEWYAPNRIEDTLAVFIHASSGEGGSPGLEAFLSMLKSRRGTEPFASWGLAVWQILLPAFRTGVTLRRQLACHREGFARVLDALGQAIALYDREGRTLHETPSLARLLSAEAQAEQVRWEMRMVARTLALLQTSSHTQQVEVAFSPVERDVRTARNRYRVRGCFACEASLGLQGTFLISVESATAVLPSVDTIRERFGLTKRESEVALLLLLRRRNVEIARELCISGHTVRTHVEKVFLKLGVHTREDVAEVLISGCHRD